MKRTAQVPAESPATGCGTDHNKDDQLALGQLGALLLREPLLLGLIQVPGQRCRRGSHDLSSSEEIRCQFAFSGKNNELTPDFLSQIARTTSPTNNVPVRL